MAAHITAAATGGPRYDDSLTEEQRRSVDNGIWCCENCGDEVDDDQSTYTVAVLREMRRLAEEKAARLFAIRAERGPDLAEAELNARVAARAILSQWRTAYDLNHARLVELDLREIPQEPRGDSEDVTWTVDDVVDALADGRTLVIRGRPGAGKTTTLLQFAEKLLGKPNAPVPLVFSVSAWASSGQDFARHVADRLAGHGVNPDLVPLLLQTRRIALLLNGWNEAADIDLARANARLRDFLLNHAGVAVAVTTREITNAPAMPGSTRLDLRPLSPAKKAAIVRVAGLTDPHAFLGELEQNRVLDEITNTPLFLAAALKLAAVGRPIPATRSALLGSFLGELERTDNHAEMLRVGPSQGFHRDYLADLAAAMTAKSATSLPVAELQVALAQCSDRLLAQRQIGTAGATLAIAENLVQHHALVLQPETAGSYAFVHQQIQEWFSAHALARRVGKLSDAPTADALFRFQREVLDQRQWREALDFAMENLVAAGQLDQAARLVRWMMPVDLLAAAELSQVGGNGVWQRVGRELGEALRAWHRKGGDHAGCALAAMLATGASDFADLYWPQLEGDDQSLMRLCRQYREFHLSSLGPDWPTRVLRWPEQQQAVFLLELSEAPEQVALEFAESRAQLGSPVVKPAALEVLFRRRAFTRLVAIITRDDFGAWDEKLFENVLRRLPRSVLEPLVDRLLGQLPDAREPLRLMIIETVARAGYRDWLALAQRELTTLGEQSPTVGMGGLIAGYSRLVQPAAPEWFAAWLVAHLSRLSGWDDQRRPRHFDDPTNAQIERLSDEQRVAIARALLAAPEQNSVSIAALKLLLSRMSEPSPLVRLVLDAFVAAPPDSNHHGPREDLEELLRELPVTVLVGGLVDKAAGLTEFADLSALVNLVSARYALDRTLNANLSAEQKAALRTLIRRVAELQTDEERARHLRPHLAVMLGAIGDPADVELVAGWLAREQARWEEHFRLLTEGVRPGQRRLIGNYGVSYWNWYSGALSLFQCRSAEEVLLGWLPSPHFIDEGAIGLVNFGRVEGSWAPRADRASEHGPIVRPALAPMDPRVRARADAIALALERREAAPVENTPHAYHVRRTAVALAQLNDVRAVPRLVVVGNAHTGWEQIEAFRALARGGHVLPGREIAAALEPFFAASEAPYHNSGSDPWYAVVDGIGVLLASDAPAAALERIRRFPTDRLHSRDSDRLFKLLAASTVPAVGDFLVELSRSVPETAGSFAGLVEALSESSSEAARERFLELVISEPPERTGEGRGALDVGAVLVGSHDAAFRAGLLPYIRNAAGPASYRLARTASNLGTEDVFDALLARDDLGDVEADLAHWIENEMEDKIPAGNGGHYLAPIEVTVIRRKLAALLGGDRRKQAVVSRLLARMQARRLHFGQPVDEKLHPDITRLPGLGMPWPLLPDAT